MPRWLHVTLAVVMALLLACGPAVFARQRYHRIRNFHVVRAGVLYRSGQLSMGGLEQVRHDFGIRTVVTLRDARDPDDSSWDRGEEQFCKREDMNYFRLPQRGWADAGDGSVLNEANVVKFRDIMKDPANYPVLVHCLAGKHRTGAMCAVFRMEHDHWSNRQAIDELSLYGYDNVTEHADILGYLTRYRPTWAK